MAGPSAIAYPEKSRMQSSQSSETIVDPALMAANNLLSAHSIAVIEAALRKVCPFGEVHLIVERGHLRFVRTIKSEAIDQAKHSGANELPNSK